MYVTTTCGYSYSYDTCVHCCAQRPSCTRTRSGCCCCCYTRHSIDDRPLPSISETNWSARCYICALGGERPKGSTPVAVRENVTGFSSFEDGSATATQSQEKPSPTGKIPIPIRTSSTSQVLVCLYIIFETPFLQEVGYPGRLGLRGSRQPVACIPADTDISFFTIRNLLAFGKP